MTQNPLIKNKNPNHPVPRIPVRMPKRRIIKHPQIPPKPMNNRHSPQAYSTARNHAITKTPFSHALGRLRGKGKRVGEVQEGFLQAAAAGLALYGFPSPPHALHFRILHLNSEPSEL
jgi:hypothetical protein